MAAINRQLTSRHFHKLSFFLSYAPLQKIAVKSYKAENSQKLFAVELKINVLIGDDKNQFTFEKKKKKNLFFFFFFFFFCIMALWKFQHFNLVCKISQ